MKSKLQIFIFHYVLIKPLILIQIDVLQLSQFCSYLLWALLITIHYTNHLLSTNIRSNQILARCETQSPKINEIYPVQVHCCLLDASNYKQHVYLNFCISIPVLIFVSWKFISWTLTIMYYESSTVLFALCRIVL